MVAVRSERVKAIDRELLHRQLARDELRYFLRYRFVAERRRLDWNWHYDYLCEALQAQTTRELRHLIINIPPGTLKSELVNQTWQAWMIGRRDSEDSSVLSASNCDDLAERDSIATRDILQSDWFGSVFPRFGLDPRSGIPAPWPKNQNKWWVTPGGAVRQAVGANAKTTGLGARRLVIDDLLAVEDANSDVKRERAIRWYRETFSSRQRDRRQGTITVIMQRLHELDLTGVLLMDEAEGGVEWEHICLPLECEKRKIYSFGSFFYAREPGEVLHPERFPDEWIAQEKRTMRMSFDGQYNQRPNKMEGNLLRPGKLVTIAKEAAELVAELGLVPNFYIDLAQTEKETQKDDPDYAAITVWAKDDAHRLIKLAQWAEQADLARVAQALIDLHRFWRPRYVKIEQGGTFNAFMPVLRAACDEQDYPIAVDKLEPDHDKIRRAGALRGSLEIGRVHVPAFAPWLVDMRLQYATFPNGAHDDIVDADAYAVRDIADLPAPRRASAQPRRQQHTAEALVKELAAQRAQEHERATRDRGRRRR